MAIDPVCGMDVNPVTARWSSEYNGETYYFCSPGCKADFDKDPQKFVDAQSGQARHHASG